MDVLDTAEQLSSTPWSTARCHKIVDAICVGAPPLPGRRLEAICLDALRARNAGIFWPALYLAGYARRDTGWLPCSDDLAYLVDAMAIAIHRRERQQVTTSEAADQLGLSDRHVRRLIRCGRLRAKLMPTGHWEVNNEDVRRMAREAKK